MAPGGRAVRAHHRSAIGWLPEALAAAVLVLGAVTPASVTAAATPHPRGLGGLNVIHKTVGAAVHNRSLAVVAAEAARHPRVGTRPTIDLRTPKLGRARPGARSIPVTSAFAPKTASPTIILPPDPQAPTQFAGIRESDSILETPADPWVAVNASYVVQVVNDMVRVSTRTGSPLISVVNEAFFGISPGHFAADPRIIWDATHGRWVGEVVYFSAGFTDDGLVLAVSDGADPSGGWTIRPISFGPFLPDFPSLASSSDKIVIVDDVYDSSEVFLAADFNAFRWSEILAGVVPTDHFCDDSHYIHPRAALVLSPSNDVHIVMEATDGSADQVYVRDTGAGECIDFTDLTDLTVDLGFDPLLESGPPPAPRQTGADTIDEATDGRVTDAVWRSNTLYWINTMPVSYDGEATWNDQVVVWSTTTAPTSGAPTGFNWAAIQPGDTIDGYMGGIGLTRSGIPIVSWSQSSSTTLISFYATSIDLMSGAGSVFGAPILVDASDQAIGLERWGDYAGVAMDPTGDGSAWVTHMLGTTNGWWRTEVARIVVDGAVPTTPGAPAATTLTATQLGTLPKYRLGWTAATDAASGVVGYRLEENIDGGGFSYAAMTSGASAVVSLSTSHSYQFRVAAIDAVGNIGGFATGPVLQPSLAQSPTSKTGTWHTSSSGSFSGGSTWYASASGASASYKTSGLRSIAIVTTKASTRGSFKVYIDGSYKATISTHTTTTSYRQVVYQYSWSSPGTHTIKIVVLATSGHPRVDVDAFLILK